MEFIGIHWNSMLEHSCEQHKFRSLSHPVNFYPPSPTAPWADSHGGGLELYRKWCSPIKPFGFPLVFKSGAAPAIFIPVGSYSNKLATTHLCCSRKYARVQHLFPSIVCGVSFAFAHRRRLRYICGHNYDMMHRPLIHIPRNWTKSCEKAMFRGGTALVWRCNTQVDIWMLVWLLLFWIGDMEFAVLT